MSLRIAFDLDGVLADMESALVRHASALFGEPEPPRPPKRAVDDAATARPGSSAQNAGAAESAADVAPDGVPLSSKLNLTRRQQRRLWRHVATIENFWETLDELEDGAVQLLADVATERRWEVIFLTKRPKSAGVTAQLQTQRWLAAKGFAMPSVFVVQGSRGRIAASLSLDVVIDDTPENCLDVLVDSESHAILVWRDCARPAPIATRRLGIGVVKSLGECLDILMKVDLRAPLRPGERSRTGHPQTDPAEPVSRPLPIDFHEPSEAALAKPDQADVSSGVQGQVIDPPLHP